MELIQLCQRPDVRCEVTLDNGTACGSLAGWRDLATGRLHCSRHVPTAATLRPRPGRQCEVRLTNGMFCWHPATVIHPETRTAYCNQHTPIGLRAAASIERSKE